MPLRTRLKTHSLYTHFRDAETLRLFIATHVFPVWDFQCLLKALQRLVTCVEVPWLPTADLEARRLLNEIVLDEESDQAPGGIYMSHFELYLQAMYEGEAEVTPIETSNRNVAPRVFGLFAQFPTPAYTCSITFTPLT